MLHYPVLLVHGLGVFAHDMENSHLWGSIPQRLREEGVSVWFSTHDAYGSVQSCSRQVASCIRSVCERTKSDKVHVVVHSKGGNDMRAALACIDGIVDHVASFITLSSPHRGLHFVDWLAQSRIIMPHILVPLVNVSARLFRDVSPDGAQIISDLTTKNMQRFAEEHAEDSYPFLCVSYGFIPPPTRGLRRLDLLRRLVTHFDGQCDGLVPVWSTEFFKWITVRVEGVRDFTHVDAMDRHRIQARFMLSDGREFSNVAEIVVDTLHEAESLLFRSC